MVLLGARAASRSYFDLRRADVRTTQDGIREYEAKNHDYLQQQIGNPDGADKPNKKYYDPRMALRSAEESMAQRLVEAAEDLNCINVL